MRATKAQTRASQTVDQFAAQRKGALVEVPVDVGGVPVVAGLVRQQEAPDGVRIRPLHIHLQNCVKVGFRMSAELCNLGRCPAAAPDGLRTCPLHIHLHDDSMHIGMHRTLHSSWFTLSCTAAAGIRSGPVAPRSTAAAAAGRVVTGDCAVVSNSFLNRVRSVQAAHMTGQHQNIPKKQPSHLGEQREGGVVGVAHSCLDLRVAARLQRTKLIAREC